MFHRTANSQRSIKAAFAKHLRKGSAATVVAAICLITVTATATNSVAAAEVQVGTMGLRMTVSLKSIKERKWKTVIRQQKDFSCGSAAIATLLSYHYGHHTSEIRVFEEMWKNGNKEKIGAKGFSLLDMRNYLHAHGYEADGFRVSLSDLQEVGIPAIVLISLKGYKHFVVVKGVTDQHVLVGDPARGLRRYRRADFEKVMVSDIIFAIRNRMKTAQSHFNSADEWSLQPMAPFGDAVNRTSLVSISVALGRSINF